jgi:hypothetical protein
MLVIGNGESRKDIDLDKHIDTKIGCNAIHRDYRVDHLICVDRRMVKEAVEQGANEHALVYTREDWFGNYKQYKRIRTVPALPYVGSDRWDEPFQWGSGPYAVLLGAKLSYKDTSGYDAGTKHAVDPRYWIHQIGKVFELYRRRKFTIYQTSNWKLPKCWNYSNVSLDTLDNL